MKGPWKAFLVLLAVAAAVGITTYEVLKTGERADAEGTAPRSTAVASRSAEAPAAGEQAQAPSEPSREAEEFEEAEGADAADAGDPRSLAAFVAGTVLDEAGNPVAEARVRYGLADNAFDVFAVFPAGTIQKDSREVLATTDETGRFRLSSVPISSGRRLSVQHPDFQRLVRGDLALPARGIDLGALRLSPGGFVAGKVVDSSGKPIAGAEVWFREKQSSSGAFAFLPDTFGPSGSMEQTDAAGKFRLTGVTPGPGQVMARASGRASAQSEELVVEARVETRVELLLAEGQKVFGFVRDEAGKPVANAEVSVSANRTTAGGGALYSASSGKSLQAATDAKGAFETEPLDPGSYSVSADAVGYARSTVRGAKAGEAVEVVLGPSGSLIGKVVDASSQKPVPGSRVVLVLDRWGGDVAAMEDLVVPMRKTVETTSGPEGAFVFADLNPGSYRVSATADGWAEGSLTRNKVESGRETGPLVLALVPEAVVSGVVRDAKTREAVVGALVVARSSGDPGAGDNEQFVVRVEDDDVVMGPPHGQNLRTRSGKDGSFRLAHLQPGLFDLEVSHPEYAQKTLERLELREGAERGDLEVLLSSGGTVEGSILGVHGEPVTRDEVQLSSAGQSRRHFGPALLRGLSDAQGYYVIEHVPPGTYVAERSSPQESPGMQFVTLEMEGASKEAGKTVVVEDGETVRVDFSKLEKPFLRGTVLSAAGPVEGARVELARSGDPDHFSFGPEFRAETDARGSYQILDVAPGVYEVSVTHPRGIVPLVESLDLSSSVPLTKDFYLDGGVVEGLVRSSAGTPLAGASVSLERVKEEEANAAPQPRGLVMISHFEVNDDEGNSFSSVITGPPVGAVQTGDDGRFTIEWVPPGTYRLKADHPRYIESHTEKFDLESNGKRSGVQVDLALGGVLEVKASKKEGTGIPGHLLQLQGPEDAHEFGVTNADGVARFEGLRPGTWTISSPGSGGGGKEQTVEVESGKETEVKLDW